MTLGSLPSSIFKYNIWSSTTSISLVLWA